PTCAYRGPRASSPSADPTPYRSHARATSLFRPRRLARTDVTPRGPLLLVESRPHTPPSLALASASVRSTPCDPPNRSQRAVPLDGTCPARPCLLSRRR